jgi:lipopolysaccharide export system protein LptA
MRFTTVFSVAAVSLLLGFGALGGLSQASRETKPPAKAAPKRDDKPTAWNIKAATMNHNDATGEGEFTEVVAVSDEDTTIHADKWRLNEKKKTALATGNLKMTDKEADATATQADIDYGKGRRLLVLTGNVEILAKPKKAATAPEQPVGPAEVSLDNGKPTVKDPNESDSDSPRKHPAIITCDRVEYEYAKSKKHATLTGNFKVVQKLSDRTRTLTAEHAEWFGLEDRILLHPPVHAEDTKNLQSFDTDEPVTVFVTEGDERIEAKKGHVVYKVQDEDEDENKAAKPDTDAKPQPPKKK